MGILGVRGFRVETAPPGETRGPEPDGDPPGLIVAQFRLGHNSNAHLDVGGRLVNRLSSIFCAFPLVALLSACSPEEPVPGARPVETPPETAESRQPSAMTVLCLGDSLTEGYGLDRSRAYPARLQEKIDALDWKFTVVNAGLGGDTTAAALRRLDWFLQRRVDVLVLALGGNDGLRGVPLTEIRKNLGAIISKTTARYPEVKVIVAGIRIPPNYGTRYVRGFGDLFPEVAGRHGALLIPFLLEGVGGRPELNFPDGIHPNSRGQEIVAENVWTVIEPVLRKLHRKATNLTSSRPHSPAASGAGNPEHWMRQGLDNDKKPFFFIGFHLC